MIRDADSERTSTCRWRHSLPKTGLILLAMIGGLAVETCPLRAADLFVDQVMGDDAFDGRNRQPTSLVSGPVRTLARGLERARQGDVIHLGPAGAVFFEAVQLQGRRHSGVDGMPFTIDGQGCILSGARLVPPHAWREVGPHLWRLQPRRKGHFLLLLEHSPLPEVFVSPAAKQVPPLEFGQWCVWQGNIYLQMNPDELLTPSEVPFALAAEEIGISLVGVQDVLIRNLTVRHFRLDGINAHDQCQRVILDHVQSIENGRAGLSVSGNSLVGASDSRFERNRIVQLLNRETAQTELLNSQLGDQPEIQVQIRGGHVLYNGSELDPRNPQLPPDDTPTPPGDTPPSEPGASATGDRTTSPRTSRLHTPRSDNSRGNTPRVGTLRNNAPQDRNPRVHLLAGKTTQAPRRAAPQAEDFGR